jgi:hypothetical protein
MLDKIQDLNGEGKGIRMQDARQITLDNQIPSENSTPTSMSRAGRMVSNFVVKGCSTYPS